MTNLHFNAPEIDALVRRVAIARYELRGRAILRDRAETAESDARQHLDRVEKELHEALTAAVSRVAVVPTVNASAITAGDLVVTSPEVLAGGNGAAVVAHTPVDLADAFEAERGDTGGGACS